VSLEQKRLQLPTVISICVNFLMQAWKIYPR